MYEYEFNEIEENPNTALEHVIDCVIGNASHIIGDTLAT